MYPKEKQSYVGWVKINILRKDWYCPRPVKLHDYVYFRKKHEPY